MSFSMTVKAEIIKEVPKARHCQMAQLAAIVSFLCKLETKGNELVLQLETENLFAANNYTTLLRKLFGIRDEIEKNWSRNSRNMQNYVAKIQNQESIHQILQGIKNQAATSIDMVVDGLVIQKSCCKRAFIKGAFLCAGSLSAPEKPYHYEIVCTSIEQAKKTQEILISFELSPKIVARKKYYVVYLKEGNQIAYALNLMGAHVALMEMENVRILKEIAGNVNRANNCDVANLNKLVSASTGQIEDIKLLISHNVLDELEDSLIEIARVRLENPYLSLAQLGELLDPPIGKSGVNHRLRKINKIADEYR